VTANQVHKRTQVAWIKWLAAIAFAGLLSGCQTFTAAVPQYLPFDVSMLGQTTDERIATYIAGHQYDKAIALIDQEPASKERQSERDAVVDARSAYIDATIESANQLIQSQSWYPVELLLQEAMAALPSQSDFIALEAVRAQDELHYIAVHSTRLHIDEAHYLTLITPTTQLLAEVFPQQRPYVNAYKDLQRRKTRLAKILLEDSRLAIEMDQFGMAQSAYDSALLLDPHSEDSVLARALTANAQQQAASTASLEAANRSLKIDALNGQFESAMRDGDLLSAQQIMEKLIILDGSNPTHVAQRVQLQNAIQTVLDIGIKNGDQKYNGGDIKGALAIWEGILPLSPAHMGLIERISRANRFLQRLEELQGVATDNET